MGKWLTIEQKRALIAQKQAEPATTQQELAEWARKEFNLAKAPARNTVSTILQRADEIQMAGYGGGKIKKPLQVKLPKLEERLGAWVKKMEQNKVTMSRALITAKARRLQAELDSDSMVLTLSDGWLNKFMRRHDLRFRVLHGEAGSVDPSIVEKRRHELQEVLERYEPDAVHNMNETGLCYSLAPLRGICSRSMRGGRRDKTRITVGLTANASGSAKLPPLYIGRARRPRCFGRKSGEQLGFDYSNNTNAWITGTYLALMLQTRS